MRSMYQNLLQQISKTPTQFKQDIFLIFKKYKFLFTLIYNITTLVFKKKKKNVQKK